MIFTPASASKSIPIRVVDGTGLPVTGLVAATMPTISYNRIGEALVGITLVDLPALTDPYSSGGIFEIGNGYYRLDIPNVAFATPSIVQMMGDALGKHVQYPPIQVATIAASVAGNIGGNVAGSVGSVIGNCGGNVVGLPFR